METYLRLMYLKHRYQLGYETLVQEVADSLSWRRFCRIPLDGAVPHATTLMKLTRRCGEARHRGAQPGPAGAAVAKKVLRSRRLRVDTTAVEADVRYPTDSGLCAHAISRIGRLVGKIKAAGMATRTRFRDRGRRAGKVVRRVSHALSGRGSRDAVEQMHSRAASTSAGPRCGRRWTWSATPAGPCASEAPSRCPSRPGADRDHRQCRPRRRPDHPAPGR